VIREWVRRRIIAWERRHPEEAKEFAIRLLEAELGEPLGEDAKRMIRNAPIDYGEKP